jgi:hypothetical protein
MGMMSCLDLDMQLDVLNGAFAKHSDALTRHYGWVGFKGFTIRNFTFTLVGHHPDWGEDYIPVGDSYNDVLESLRGIGLSP